VSEHQACVTCRKPLMGKQQLDCSRQCKERSPIRRHHGHARICIVCGASYSPTYSKQTACSRECGVWVKRGYPGVTLACERLHGQCSAIRLRVIHPAPHLTRSCKRCGSSVGVKKQYCESCRDHVARQNRRHASRERRQPGNDRARAQRARVEYAHINRRRVFERDRWRCHICGRQTDKVAYLARAWDHYKHQPLYPTLDHLIPLAHGGAHTYGNVACACWECNVIVKGTRAVGEQLLLVG
jgi:hypothetical protein